MWRSRVLCVLVLCALVLCARVAGLPHKPHRQNHVHSLEPDAPDGQEAQGEGEGEGEGEGDAHGNEEHEVVNATNKEPGKDDDVVSQLGRNKMFLVDGVVDRDAMRSANNAIATLSIRRDTGEVSDEDENDAAENAVSKLQVEEDVDANTSTGRYVVRSGSPLRLNFKVSNARNYFWTKDKLHVRHEGSHGELFIRQPQPSDSGFYRCMASNGDQTLFSKEVFVDVEGYLGGTGQQRQKISSTIDTVDPLQVTRCLEQLWDDTTFLNRYKGSLYAIPPACEYAKGFCAESQTQMCEQAGLGAGSGSKRPECSDSEIKCRWMIRDCFLQTDAASQAGLFEHCVYAKSMHLFGVPKNDDSALLGVSYALESEPDEWMCLTDFSPDRRRYVEFVGLSTDKIRFRVEPADGATFELAYALFQEEEEKEKPKDEDEVEKEDEGDDTAPGPRERRLTEADFHPIAYNAKGGASEWVQAQKQGSVIDKKTAQLMRVVLRTRVTSEDTTNVTDYTVRFQQSTKSADYTLYELDIVPQPKEFVFRTDVDQYDDLEVSEWAASIQLIPNAKHDTKSTMRLIINGQSMWGELTDRVDLLPGRNVVQLQMVSQLGEFADEVYTLSVVRQLPNRGDVMARHNALLEEVEVRCSGMKTPPLSPDFDAEWFFYRAALPASCTSVTFRPRLMDHDAFLEVDGMATPHNTVSAPRVLLSGSNVLEVVVTAMDRHTANTYTFLLEREASDAVALPGCDTGGVPWLQDVSVMQPHAASSLFDEQELSLVSLENPDEAVPTVLEVPSHVHHVYIKASSPPKLLEFHPRFTINDNAIPSSDPARQQYRQKPYPRFFLAYGVNMMRVVVAASCQPANDASQLPVQYAFAIKRRFPHEDTREAGFSGAVIGEMVDGDEGVSEAAGSAVDASDGDSPVVTLGDVEVAAEVRWGRARFVKHVDLFTPPVHFGVDDQEEGVVHLEAKVPSGVDNLMVRAIPVNPAAHVLVNDMAVNRETGLSKWMPFTKGKGLALDVFSPKLTTRKRYHLDVLEASSSSALMSLRVYPVSRVAGYVPHFLYQLAKEKDCGCEDSCFKPDGPLAGQNESNSALCHVDINVSGPDATNDVHVAYMPPFTTHFFVAATTDPQHNSEIQFEADDAPMVGLRLSEFQVLGLGLSMRVIVTSEDHTSHSTYSFTVYPDSRKQVGHALPNQAPRGPHVVEFRLDEEYVYLRLNGFFPPSGFNFKGKSRFDAPLLVFHDTDGESVKWPLVDSYADDTPECDPYADLPIFDDGEYDPNLSVLPRCLLQDCMQSEVTKSCADLGDDKSPDTMQRCACEKGAIGFADEGVPRLWCRWECALARDARFLKLRYEPPVDSHGRSLLHAMLDASVVSLLLPKQALEAIDAEESMRVDRTMPATLLSARLRFYGTGASDNALWGEFVMFLEFDKPIPCPGFLSMEVEVEGKWLELRNHYHPKLVSELVDLDMPKFHALHHLLSSNRRDRHPMTTSDFRWTSTLCSVAAMSSNPAPHWIVDAEVTTKTINAEQVRRYTPTAIVSEADPTVLILRSRQTSFSAGSLERLRGRPVALTWRKGRDNVHTVRDATGQRVRLPVTHTDQLIDFISTDLEQGVVFPALSQLFAPGVVHYNAAYFEKLVTTQRVLTRLLKFPSGNGRDALLYFLLYKLDHLSWLRTPPDLARFAGQDTAAVLREFTLDPKFDSYLGANKDTSDFLLIKNSPEDVGFVLDSLAQDFKNGQFVSVMDWPRTLARGFLRFACSPSAGEETVLPGTHVTATRVRLKDKEVLKGMRFYAQAVRPNTPVVGVLMKSCMSVACLDPETPVGQLSSALKPLFGDSVPKSALEPFPGKVVAVTQSMDLDTSRMRWHDLVWQWVDGNLANDAGQKILRADCPTASACSYWFAVVPTSADESKRAISVFQENTACEQTTFARSALDGLEHLGQPGAPPPTSFVKPVTAFKDVLVCSYMMPAHVPKPPNPHTFSPTILQPLGSCPGTFSGLTEQQLRDKDLAGRVLCGGAVAWPECCVGGPTGCKDVPVDSPPQVKCAACLSRFECPSQAKDDEVMGAGPEAARKIFADTADGGVLHNFRELYGKCDAPRKPMKGMEAFCLPLDVMPCDLRVPLTPAHLDPNAPDGALHAANPSSRRGQPINFLSPPVLLPSRKDSLMTGVDWGNNDANAAYWRHMHLLATFGYSKELGSAATPERLTIRQTPDQAFDAKTEIGAVMGSGELTCAAFRGVFEHRGSRETAAWTAAPLAVYAEDCEGTVHGQPCRLPSDEGFCHGCCMPRTMPSGSGYWANSLWLLEPQQAVRLLCDANLEVDILDMKEKYSESDKRRPWMVSDRLKFFSANRISICQAAWFVGRGAKCSQGSDCSVIATIGDADTFEGVMEPRTFNVRWDAQRYGPP